MEIDITEFILKTGAGAFAGLLMGLERQFKGKPAGLKTNMLVALGASAFIIISLIFQDSGGTDMTRIVGQVVVGVGFLGAGVILHGQDGKKVEGLATAATIWCSAAAGCFAGFGLYLPLLVFTIFVVIINLVFGYLNVKVKRHADKNE
ncbi:MgtC/SapB family protein [Christiangramia sabulilitoris]|uniref:MgtC/SapB family protein n=1 Tax=Christiangramia sabulilitoris TaxID=2583991 RepID=A0A550I812_9FLAO|nr:MgtC/SapB family protein [Christiangramia sabulilitoris]TRO67109.1 MgtC/SapB family protein [Christiangramia sabulilitoris]